MYIFIESVEGCSLLTKMLTGVIDHNLMIACVSSQCFSVLLPCRFEYIFWGEEATLYLKKSSLGAGSCTTLKT